MYANEERGKYMYMYDFIVSCLLMVIYLLSLIIFPQSLNCEVHCIELLVTIIAPRTKTGLAHCLYSKN